ncbi:MAG: hypothetical protein ABIP34_12985 [Rhodoferax sp.]
MKINNASSTALTAQQALAAAKKTTVNAVDKTTKEFGAIATSVIDGASQASSTLGKVVNGVENEIKAVANNTVALATSGANELKSAYNSVAHGVGTVASGVGTVASAAANYASTGLSAAAQAVNALV